jgi:hypothetical protein
MGSLTQILANISAAIPELINNSATAIYKKLAEAFSITVDVTMAEFANTEAIIDSNIAANNYGKSGYYINAALYYEDGEDMVIDPVTQNWIYSPVDVSKQTISQAAFDESSLTLKVAYTDPSTGLLAKLPSDVLTRFIAYFNNSNSGGFAIPGIPITIVSLDPNMFNASSFTITYYGSYSLTNIQTAVQAALTAFRDSFEYNGILYIQDLSDYIKNNVSGVRDVSIILPEIDGTVFVGNKSLPAGYFDFDSGLTISYNAI